ncbi:peroxiredoxin family protein [Candidatus Caldatribacterium sp.]|uniref:peroxiredoxin family protein n=1 Tax=Candidatus Caldatribacterium sp. TaxID=2282143 RepID=UPI00384019EB|nr:TlpA family protein disulfide reductase [Candidatus Caldatribacterium sp.]
MRRMLPLIVLASMVAVVFTLSGCSWFEGFFPSPSPSPSPLPGNTDMDRKDFTIFFLDGSAANLSSFKGKPVLLVFFLPGCSACKNEVPALNEVYTKYKDRGLVVLGAGYGTPESIATFRTSTGAQYPIGYFADKEEIVELYDFTHVPHNVFFDRNGNITRTYNGPMSLSTLESYLSEIL